MLVKESGESFLQLFIELPESTQGFVAPGFIGRGFHSGISFVDFLIEQTNRFDELAQVLDVIIAVVDLFIDDHAIESLFGGLRNELFGQGDVFFGSESEAINGPFKLALGIFDPFGNFDFLLAGEQRDLTHLFQVHPHRIVQDIEPALVLLFLDFGLLDAIYFGLINDLDLQTAQLDVNVIKVFGIDHAIWERVVDVVVSKIALFLGEPDKFLDFVCKNGRFTIASMLAIGWRYESVPVLMSVAIGLAG